MVDDTLLFDVEVDRKNKTLKLFQKIEVVPNDDERLQKGTPELSKESFISLSEAKKVDSSLEIGDFLQYDLEFENMGRNAATILNSNLEYKIQRLIENNLFNKYKQKIGKTISGTVTRVDRNENTFIEIDEVKGILDRKHRIKGESFKVGDVLKAVVKGVYIDKSLGFNC